MKSTYESFNYDYLWTPSGDPFVDAGGYAIKVLLEKFPNKDIMELIKMTTDIYVDKWDSKLNAFFLNSNITQPNFNSKQKKEETIKFFEKIIKGEDGVRGTCRILGIESYLYPSGRNMTVLTGSGDFSNFHHSFETGLMLSREAIVRYHFLPFASEMLLRKVCVVSSNNVKTSEFFVKGVVEKNIMNLGQNSSFGVVKNESQSHGTAMFRFIDKVLANTDYSDDNEIITIYNFTNYGASPNLEIYTLPFLTYFFYRETQKSVFKETWTNFINHYYKSSEKPINNSVTRTYDKETKGTIQVDQEEYFKYWSNTIYDYLLTGKSLLGIIRKWSIINKFDMHLLKVYLINILKMKNETILKINEIVDFILKYTKETEMKRTLAQLNGIKNASLLRRFILKIVEKNYAIGNDSPIVTVEDYVNYLFPDTSSWTELRDVMIINIYQKLHEEKINVEVEIEDEIMDDEI